MSITFLKRGIDRPHLGFHIPFTEIAAKDGMAAIQGFCSRMTTGLRFGRRRVAVLLFAAICFPAVASSAAPRPPPAESLAHAPPLHVVFGGDRSYPPFDFIDQDGQATGFDVELFRSVAAHGGLEVEFRLGGWDKTLADLTSGKIDVVPMLVTDQRSTRFRFSQPFLSRYHLVFGPRGRAYVPTLDALVGQRVAVQSAGMAWEELSRVAGVQLVLVDVEAEALLAVKQGRADYAVVPMFIGYEAQHRFKLDELVPLSPPVLQRGYAYAVAPGSEHLLTRINAGLREASRSGDHNRLYLQWLANLTPSGESYRSGLTAGLWIAVPLLAAAILLLVWWRRARKRVAVETLSRARAEEWAQHLAFHDPVTLLANRHALRQELERLIASQRPFSVVRVDLLGIDAIEAVAGHGFVDQLLLVLAQRLRDACAHELIAKIGDSGFMMARLDAHDVESARQVMQSAIQRVHSRVEVSGVPLEPACCAGVALFPQHGTNADDLMRAAGVACVAARNQPGSGVVYDPALAPDPRNLTLLADLRVAIREQTLGYALQPKLDLATRRVSGAELLVRWSHPKYGLLPPDMFVPLAEKTEVIGEMTLYLVRQAIAHCRDWRRRGLALRLSVNVSVNDLSDTTLVDSIVDVSAGIGDRLMLEITETAVMRDPTRVFAAVQRLRACGVGISLDDFGTGHASLTYLRRLSPDEVKIDRSFIAGIFTSEADQSIVRSSIQLAHSLGAIVTAEGVEDWKTLEWLAAAGCDNAQGYYIARPMALADFVGSVTKITGTPASAA